VKLFIFIFTILVIITGCSKEKNVLFLNEKRVSLSAIDSSVNILLYQVRNEAANKLIEQFILTEEIKKNSNFNLDSLIKRKINCKSLIVDSNNKEDDGSLPSLNSKGIFPDPKLYYRELIIDSLKGKYNIVSMLPLLYTREVKEINHKGLYVMLDFNCLHCREIYPKLKLLTYQYPNIKFKIDLFSYQNDKILQLFESAKIQGLNEKTLDYLFLSDNIINDEELFNFLMLNNFNTALFKKQFKSGILNEAVTKKKKFIESNQIGAFPLFIVSNKLLPNSFSSSDLDMLLKNFEKSYNFIH
jgi:hypothetical protein